ncbi:MAG: cytochrome b, partial [Desulfobulbia bacterium]
MSLKSTQTRYSNVVVTIHWLTAILIIAALGSGFRAANTLDITTKSQLLAVHVSLAMTVVLLTLARILWWWFLDKKPDPVADTPTWQHISAQAIHLLFYVVILGMGASGIGMLVLSGAGPIIFGSVEGQLPNFWDFKPRVPHGIGARVLIALLIFHTSAALYHHFIRRDGLLWRMWYGKS